MTDREKMIQIIDAWEWDDSFQPKGFIPNADLADRLIEAGFGRVNVSFKKFREDVLYHGFHERWDDVKQLVRKELE